MDIAIYTTDGRCVEVENFSSSDAARLLEAFNDKRHKATFSFIIDGVEVVIAGRHIVRIDVDRGA